MKERQVKGILLIGEVVEVKGWIGGYNLKWEWYQGWVEGKEE